MTFFTIEISNSKEGQMRSILIFLLEKYTNVFFLISYNFNFSLMNVLVYVYVVRGFYKGKS